MRTAEEIREHLIDLLASMMKRPGMYGGWVAAVEDAGVVAAWTADRQFPAGLQITPRGKDYLAERGTGASRPGAGPDGRKAGRPPAPPRTEPYRTGFGTRRVSTFAMIPGRSSAGGRSSSPVTRTKAAASSGSSDAAACRRGR